MLLTFDFISNLCTIKQPLLNDKSIPCRAAKDIFLNLPPSSDIQIAEAHPMVNPNPKDKLKPVFPDTVLLRSLLFLLKGSAGETVRLLFLLHLQTPVQCDKRCENQMIITKTPGETQHFPSCCVQVLMHNLFVLQKMQLLLSPVYRAVLLLEEYT